MKTYGKSDPDPAAEVMLRELVKDLSVEYFILHARKPIDARPCQLPGSILAQAVLTGGRVVSVQQTEVGGKPRRT